MSDIKPRIRVQAGSSRQGTTDNFMNFQAALGYGTNNISSGGTYGWNPVSRNRVLLEWAYRGAWLVKKVVDCPADDMTREGIDIESDMPPDQIDKLQQYWTDLQLWQRINSTLKWARLYGGAIGVLMIEGQKLDTPLRIETVGKDQFKGLLVLDRWMVWPHMEDPITEYSPDYGLPKYYDTIADARSLPNMHIHHSRCIRLDGIELPYWQRMAENLWGLSVIEPMWDRMIAFDSATQGAAQLIYKAHLRVMKIADYRENIASMGKAHQAVLQMLNMIRLMQTNEGLTVLDKEDDFQANTYNFSGLSDMMIQFSQQVSGAADVPMTRLFGQSPAGMNSTGESDLRNYYDGIKSQQESRLRRYITLLLHLTHRSRFGIPLPEGFNYSFSPLWQLTQVEKSTIAQTIAGATSTLFQDGILSQKAAMKETRQWSRITGFGSNITDEELNAIPEGPPSPFAAQMAVPDPMGSSGGMMPSYQAGSVPVQGGKPPIPHKPASEPEDDAKPVSEQHAAERQHEQIELVEQQIELVEQHAEAVEKFYEQMEGHDAVAAKSLNGSAL